VTGLRILILTPTALPNSTGNAISAERWRRFLSEQGALVHVIGTEDIDVRDFISNVDSFRPHLVHAHHISRAGSLMLDPLVAKRYGSIPMVISPGGTDVNNSRLRETDLETLGTICRKACFIISQNPEMSRRLEDILPAYKNKIVYVAKAPCWFGDDYFDLRSAAGCRKSDVLYFMPAGVRAVKGNLECLLGLEEAHAECNRIKVLFAGPKLDSTYAKSFEEQLYRLRKIARWTQIPLQAMRSAYSCADVVLNHSSSEGLSNSLLEAVSSARPILASGIPGNLWLIDDENHTGPAAFLFDPDDRKDFVSKALHLTEPVHREVFAEAARKRALTLPTPSDEARGLLEVYRSALNSNN
jgi:L-malate glycosyltransferase